MLTKRAYVITVEPDPRGGPNEIVNVQSGTPEAVNCYELLATLGSVVKQMSLVLLQQSAALNQDKGYLPHDFIALAGEERCRVPGCNRKAYDPIHQKPVNQNEVM